MGEVFLRYGIEADDAAIGGDTQGVRHERLDHDGVAFICDGLEVGGESGDGEDVGGVEGAGEEEAF